jgi:hypothetical protein
MLAQDVDPELLAAAPMGSQPMPPIPTGQFQATPGSSSAPAIVVQSSQFARAEISYPRYEPPPDVDDVRITSRWPLVLGILIVVVGLAAVIIIAFWDFGDKQAELASQPEPAKPEPAAATAPAKPTEPEAKPPEKAPALDKKDVAADKPPAVADDKPAEPPKIETPKTTPSADAVTDPPDDPMIGVHVESVPSGAEVLIDAKSVGSTPLELKLKRRQGSATLVVHRAHFKDEVSKLDFMADFTKKVTLKKLVGEPPPKAPMPTKAPPITHAVKEPAKAPEPPKPAPKEDCQPQGQVNPFDTRPPCK